nr:AI-2E family transporter [Acidimicrobiia bacterium]
LLGFLIVLAGAAAVIGVAVGGELDDLGPTLSEGVDDVTDWLVEDGPFDVSRSDVERWREQAGDTLSSFIGSGDDRLVSGAIIAVEVVIGSLLAVIVTFFFLKDGPRMFDRAVALFPVRRQPLARRVGGRAWTAIGGYLRGAALLGAVESVTVGDASLAVGSSLVAPIMLITFLAAFVPIVGAVVAGVIAVLVALVTAGAVPALIVAGVAIVVQQLDNDLLAPIVYSRALQLHPLVILLGVAVGGSLFGLVGTVFAVPFIAVVLNGIDEARHDDPGAQPA